MSIEPPKSPRSPMGLTFEIQQSRILKLEDKFTTMEKDLKRLNEEIEKNREHTLELMNRLRLSHVLNERLADRVAAIEGKWSIYPI